MISVNVPKRLFYLRIGAFISLMCSFTVTAMPIGIFATLLGVILENVDIAIKVGGILILIASAALGIFYAYCYHLAVKHIQEPPREKAYSIFGLGLFLPLILLKEFEDKWENSEEI